MTATIDAPEVAAAKVPDRANRANGPARSRRFTATLIRLASVALMLGIWQIITMLEIWPELIVPRPSSVWHRFVESITTHDGVRGFDGYLLWEHLGASGWRLFLGVGVALLVGIPLGLALATITPFRLAFEPMLNFIRSLPPLAYFSLLIIWFGIENTSKIWLLFIAAVAPISLAVVSGAASTRRDWIDAARSLGASRLQVLRFTVLPSLLPELITGIRVAVGFAFTTIVAAETVNGIPGIGGLAWSTKKFNQTDIAILCVIVIGLSALAIDRVIRVVELRVVPWRGRA